MTQRITWTRTTGLTFGDLKEILRAAVAAGLYVPPKRS